MLPPSFEVVQSEEQKVEAWRLHVLIEAGYSMGSAATLAGRSDVDLHQAVELLEAGCEAETAAEILL